MNKPKMINRKAMPGPVFKTRRRIRLGVWGLGRGRAFYDSCRLLNLDIVAGCDYNPAMRSNFLEANPGAFVSDDAEKFLARDFDAVLLATFCPAHADDAIACLKAGKHVLSEVTSFHTMAEGVRLVEAVEKSGLVYNLAENYPFSAANMWLRNRWQEGLFGDLMYAEYEYVHELLILAYTTLFQEPLIPGDQSHAWRSWLHYHYYNTHSLGPMMYITGLRPIRVVALPEEQRVPGTLVRGHNGTLGVAASLINMSNGAVVRNLMGSMPGDTHQQRIWGTLGAAQITGSGLEVRLGGRGHSPMQKIVPHWEQLAEYASKTGHGGGDFWVLFNFARQILEGVKAPFELYNACDCTIPGILAFRSQNEGGKPFAVPDFRDKAQREPFRNDHYAQQRYDTRHGLFPKDADTALTHQFSETMRDLIAEASLYRSYRDWSKIQDDVSDILPLANSLDVLLARLPKLRAVQQRAQKIAERYPESDGARVLNEMLGFCDTPRTSQSGFEKQLQDERRKLTRKIVRAEVAREKKSGPDGLSKPAVRLWQSAVARIPGLVLEKAPAVALSDRLGWRWICSGGYVHGHLVLVEQGEPTPRVVYAGNRFRAPRRGRVALRIGHDCPLRVFLDGKPIGKTHQPGRWKEETTAVPVVLSQGSHEIVLALWAGGGKGRFYFQLGSDITTKSVYAVFNK